MKLNPEIWGPKYWFFLHSVAMTYPETPNAITKRKYYDLIQNMPLFIPCTKIGDKFGDLLLNYPVTPYLANRDSFIRWVWFIHNKINKVLDKEQISLYDSLDKYNAEFLPRDVQISKKIHIQKGVIYTGVISMITILILAFHE
jgi:hypothetical protein